MSWAIVLGVLSDLSFIATAAYLIGRSRYIMKCIRKPSHPLNWFSLTVLFSLLSIIGTYNAIPWAESLITTRLAGVLLGGILGGPLVGVSVGVISGGHLTLLEGTSAIPYAFVAVIGGLYAGLIRRKKHIAQINWVTGVVIAASAEVGQYLIVALFEKIMGLSGTMDKGVFLPTTIASIMAVGIFIMIIHYIEVEQDVYGAKAAQLSLAIASRTLPYLRHGLTAKSAQVTAQIIYQLTKVDEVSITDCEKIIAFVGKKENYTRIGEPIADSVVQRTIDEEAILLSASADCQPIDGRQALNSSVIAPLFANSAVIGTINLSRDGIDAISEVDIRLADGVANLLSVQIQLADSEQQRKMRERAELKALQAQINPHFIFNTLNIIMSFCRTDPDKARNLLGHLATMLQRSFANRDFVALQDELAGIEAYLEIAKPRFGARLEIVMTIDPQVLGVIVPALSLQPLVENAVQHGLFPKLYDCVLVLSACREDDVLLITIADNGVGISPDKLQSISSAYSERIGISNVYRRLQSIYGDEYGLEITSALGKGTQAYIRIPYKENEKIKTEVS